MNAELSPDDHFYEWLLSDHPAAASERARRRLDHQLAEAIDLERLRGWLAKIDQLAKDGQPLGDSVRRLAEQARTRLIPNAEQRLVALTNTSDQVRVHRARQEFETSLQVGRDPDYRYRPATSDPGCRPADPARAVGATPRPRGGTDPQRPHGQGPGRREQPLWVRPHSGDHPPHPPCPRTWRPQPDRPPARRRPTIAGASGPRRPPGARP